MLLGPTRQKYKEELRAFALTLSFYSAKAYNYVRQTFNKSLPHLSTISKWYQSIDGSPGFTSEAFEAVKFKVAEQAEKGEKVVCNLVMDEMAIMKRVEWTGKKFTGYVDIGAHIDSDSVPEAKEAIIFMLVALNGHWKIPVGYFLIDGLSGPEKANLVIRLLEWLHDTGVIITSMTFDGAPCNIRMATELGANLTDSLALKTFFLHPVTNEKIYIFMDPCHMLKLTRNCLASQKVLKDGEGNNISWSYFEKLSELQYSEGLRAGTKISKRHIQWFREKMKVKLAAQTFSNSVADAFIFLQDDMHLPDFEGVTATAKFTRVINNLFDIFNSRNRFSKSTYRQALSVETAEKIFNYLSFCKNYINSLTLNDKSITKTNRKTGFIGFLVCINSLEGLFNQIVVETPLLKYIISYKLSQDHLEIFFSIIRSKGGFNNNPTGRQLEYIYKRLLIHAEIKGSEHANVTAIDKTSILYCSSKITKDDQGNDLLESVDYKALCEEIDELDFLQSSAWHLTPYCADVVAYIAGFVVKCLKRCVTCKFCLGVLEEEVPISKLQMQKAYGLLVNASSFVVEVCRAAEKCLKVFLTRGYFMRRRQHVSELIINQTLRNLPTTTYDVFGDHIFDFDQDNYHPVELLKLILKKYVSIRIHHETKKMKDFGQDRVRSLLTKTILFKGQ